MGSLEGKSYLFPAIYIFLTLRTLSSIPERSPPENFITRTRTTQMQLFNRVKSIRVGGKAKVKTKHAPSNVENACQTDALPAAASQGGSQVDSISIASERWEEFCRKYEQRPKNLQTNLVPSGSTSTIRTTYLDNLLYHTAKLHEHHWTLLCQHEKYKGREYSIWHANEECCTQ